MKKLFLLLTIPILSVLISCNGLLWSGQSQNDQSNMSIRIPNPISDSNSVSNNRAATTPGQYIYIELAWIDDAGIYNSSTLPKSGVGTWIETDWGGHAILTFNLLSTGELYAYFRDIPLDKDLIARVIVENSYSDFYTNCSSFFYNNNSDFDSYYGGDPIPQFQTRDINANTIWGDFDIPISVEELKTGVINLTLVVEIPF